jgi:hypothetical protein
MYEEASFPAFFSSPGSPTSEKHDASSGKWRRSIVVKPQGFGRGASLGGAAEEGEDTELAGIYGAL